MKKMDRPSEYFLGAILRGFDACKPPVTCADIWHHVVIECLHRRDFETMFAWDTSRAQNRNRIRDIQECIERGHVPGLHLERDERRVWVVEE